MRDYPINSFYSQEDAGYIANLPDLEPCSAFGEPPEAALKQVQSATSLWIAAAQETGLPIPEPKYRPAIYQAAG